MQKNLLVNGETMDSSVQGMLEAEQFLKENYLLRRNVLNGKTEFATLCDGSITSMPRALTPEALNSIILRAKRQGLEDTAKRDITTYINSEEVPAFDPIREFLNSLPAWDCHNHVSDLFGRLPGISSEQLAFLSIWLRSVVAHWMQMDTLHGNECVPTLIGAQGCGKTTFLRRLLPASLREYYLDHLNLSNKFDKEMALTNNLLVNLDELEAIRPSQHAALKQTLSKSKVNGRPIFGRSQEDRPRYASFVATTNNPHPLTDVTGSRRYICILIPAGQLINNVGNIDYEQLYAQVLHEVREDKAPYWFNNDEVTRIQQMNIEYMEKKDIGEILSACFRKPREGEDGYPMSNREILQVLKLEYPSLTISHASKVHLGMALKDLAYEYVNHHNIIYYKVVPLKAA